MSKDRNIGEGQSLGDNMKTGEPLMERAVQALRRYHEAKETQPAEKVEKLRLEAEELFAAVQEYQRQALGGSHLGCIERNPERQRQQWTETV